MHWFWVALAAPFVWSLVNHADKILLARYFHGGGSGGLMIFVGVVAAPLAFMMGLYDPGVLSVSAQSASILIASGVLYNIAVYFYLKVLETHDASYVVPFWQLVPVCAYIFGIIFLNEFLTADRVGGALVVMFGAIFLSLRIGSKRIAFDYRSVLLMVLSSATIALGYVFFKDVEASTTFYQSIFWNQIGMAIFGGIFFLIPSFRMEFFGALRRNSLSVVGLNIVEQLFEIVGVLLANYAVLLAPAALVILIEYSFQPMFVFALGVLFTLLFPTFVREDISPATLVQKSVAIVIMGIGVAMVLH